jgi:hypothetical protein
MSARTLHAGWLHLLLLLLLLLHLSGRQLQLQECWVLPVSHLLALQL